MPSPAACDCSLREEDGGTTATRPSALLDTLGHLTVTIAEVAEAVRSLGAPAASQDQGRPTVTACVDALQDSLRGARNEGAQSSGARTIADGHACRARTRGPRFRVPPVWSLGGGGSILNSVCHTNGRQTRHRKPPRVARLAGKQRPPCHVAVGPGWPHWYGALRICAERPKAPPVPSLTSLE